MLLDLGHTCMGFTDKFLTVYLALKMEEETSNERKIGLKQVI